MPSLLPERASFRLSFGRIQLRYSTVPLERFRQANNRPVHTIRRRPGCRLLRELVSQRWDPSRVSITDLPFSKYSITFLFYSKWYFSNRRKGRVQVPEGLSDSSDRRGRRQDRPVCRSPLLHGQRASSPERIGMPTSLWNRKRIPLQIFPIPWPSPRHVLQLPIVPSGPLNAARWTIDLPKCREATDRQRGTSWYLLRKLLRK